MKFGKTVNQVYHREGFRRLGIGLGCLASIAWIVFFAPYFHRVYTAYNEFPAVERGTRIDKITRRLNQQIPTSVRGEALADRVVADKGFQKLTRNQQIVVLEYLEGKSHSDRAEPLFRLAPPVRVIRGQVEDVTEEGIGVGDLPSGDHTTAEKELEARLGPDRPMPEQLTVMPKRQQRHPQAAPIPSVIDEMGRAVRNTTVIDTVVRTHYAFNGFRLLVLVGELVAGSIVAFAALFGLVAGVDWVAAGFE
jgi:hypothetical protein